MLFLSCACVCRCRGCCSLSVCVCVVCDLFIFSLQTVCVCPVWVPCVALPSGGGSSVGPSPLCGSPGWVPWVGPLCGSPVWVPSVWVPCVGPLCGSLAPSRSNVASTRVMHLARAPAPAYRRRVNPWVHPSATAAFRLPCQILFLTSDLPCAGQRPHEL